MASAGTSGDAADDVVLTGISGRLPDSDTIEEFAEKLFAGVDLVTSDDRRWTPGIFGLTTRNGKLKNLTHFDASFFGVHGKQAHLMDPAMRILLEVTYEALVDAGINPAELRGSRTGVYVGICVSETFYAMAFGDPDKFCGYEVIGGCLTMFANRVSFSFDFTGPSYALDSGCSSSMFAFAQATQDIRSGLCDAAIVAGTTLCLTPLSSLHFQRLTVLSPDGRSAAFDASANGYVRSEAVVAALLQRRGAARRVYATVRGARVNHDGRKEEGISFPSSEMQSKLARETFQEAGLRPEDVVYFEAHGTGTKVGDPLEANAITEVFCKNRQKPLLIGSVKSNMGHTEATAALCSIAKVVIAMESGVIPGNLHYQSPNPDIPALRDGRLQVVSRNTEWDGGLVAVNSFGFGGTNAHVILESEKGSRVAKVQAPGEAGPPRLVLASGRTEEAVRALLQHAQAHRDSAALHALMDAVHALPIPRHGHRGYCLLTDPPQEEILEVEGDSSGETQPVWFVFSGIGSQCPGVARSLLAVPVFAASIARSAQVLRPHGIDLLHLLTEADGKAFDNVINSFVSIAAVQVALVDVLREVGITPDGIIGTSVGEIACAYADEALTAEQTVLCAYWRGRSVLDAKLPSGAMAALGLSWDEAQHCCPPDVELACHNSQTSVTIAGPVKSIEKLVAEMAAKGIFARSVNSSGVAFHSKYVAAAAPLLHKSLKKLIPNPNPRSARWVTSSLPEEQWGAELAKLCSAEYLVNNLVSPVRLARALEQVPGRAVVVELAPHALLQAVLRRALPLAAHVPLLRRDTANATHHLLAALGKLFVAGCQPRVGHLYPPVPWPVPRGTPSLGSHVRWDHSLEWNVADMSTLERSAQNAFEFDLSSAEHAFITGHNIDGRIVFPVAGYLTLVWRAMAKMHSKMLEETCIVLENVEIRSLTTMTREMPVRFVVNILEETGEFKVFKDGTIAVTGVVWFAEERAAKWLAPANPLDSPAPTDTDLLPLDTNDIYKELRLRGYDYSGIFRGICVSDQHGISGQLTWNEDWVAFLETMLQFSIIGMDTRGLYLVKRLQRVVIDPIKQTEALARADGILPVKMDRNINVVMSGGVEMQGIKTSLTPRGLNPQPAPKLDKYEFVPYNGVSPKDTSWSNRDALAVSLQLVLENTGSFKLNIMEFALEREPNLLLLPLVMQLLEGEPLVYVDPVLVTSGSSTASYASLQELGVKVTDKNVQASAMETEYHVVLAADVMSRELGALPALAGALAARGALLLQEPLHALDTRGATAAIAAAGLVVLSRQVAAGSEFILLGRRTTLPTARVVLEVTSDREFAWLPRLQAAIQQAAAEESRVYLWSREQDSGILGLATCLRGEVGECSLRVFHVPDARTAFEPDALEYSAQVQKDLAVNVLHAGVWGCYRYLPLTVQDAAPLVQVEHAYVNTVTCGDLSSLRWIESELQHAAEQPLPVGTDLCLVHYASLNLRDVMLATGKLPPDALSDKMASQEYTFGQEFSGYSSRGARVMGMVVARGLATSVLCNEAFLWRVPDAWSLEEAATVPVAYATAYYALMVRGRMRRSEAVLVHAGAGGIGQAAITVALHAGCTVFTTVGTLAERAFLLARFPALLPEHIGSSCDISFEQLVMGRTHGRGVDLILNSLADDQLLASVRCLAEGGRFLELGRFDFFENAPLGMSVFLKNTTFHGILLDALFEVPGDDADRATVVRCVSEGIAKGIVRPLPATVFPARQLEQAFRCMAAGEQVGKVVLHVRGAAEPVCAVPRSYMRAHRSYVLVGGLGGFGLELGSWLVARGARQLVLVSRSGVRSGYQARCVRRWRRAGVRVLLSTEDASTPKGARRLLRAARELAPVAGLFNLAAELRDCSFENQTEDDFRAVAKPKINITRALDIASRELVPELEYFVVFSSIASGRCCPGQSNYSLANCAMERVMEQRRADGLHGLAIQWGPVGEVSLNAARHAGEEGEIVGTAPQRMASCLETLEAVLASPHAIISSLVVADKRRRAPPATQDIVHSIANILGIKDPSKVSQNTTLIDLGMDSLMIAEIQHALECDCNLTLGVHEIRTLTFARLRQLGGAGADGPDA